MIGVIVNAVAVILGGGIGLLFGKKISQRFTDLIFAGLMICVLVMGVQNAIKAPDMLDVIICVALGCIIGEGIRIDKHIGKLSIKLEERFAKNDSQQGRFAEGFLTTSLLFCVGSMGIMGSFDAGLHSDYTILFSKSVIDGISAIGFAAALGAGVLFSSASVFVYQGAFTLLASLIRPLLSEQVTLLMNAVGGILLIGLALDLLFPIKKRFKIANMIPCMFLPIAYSPLKEWIMAFLA